ncbi:MULTISPECIES: LysR family transcriptional regulator [unclassified Mesorhizobium]|uniref:LysR family transcriptional regulator n=1 Tax=unclassified Mesorhizobium TaxID=325217 RepID=UPI000FD76E52|nr:MULTISPECIES: LysR family transcriptional regulator [unclassified Mesorhizobium]TGR58311.1 LysR family transcriptional regulator [bacterium M00.F.Ca.ET.199.01.1.1]TGU41580.1 LysR family transcriptional regulator [bacterium M00.F.Ca.ET.156.01.1.1]TGV89796.1 LysR family transcriptional regulator [Mesorhizobium sp. M00.F.Ca.ET.149.01.1.1]TIT68464.1 MAG: LysR family transcriptional regulator [Mesorhizobium sp.]TGQ83834.1 LysR family transcriptional regulator [Mesorhizobium sp. M8A.F.Ca.ET.207.0
MALPRPERLVWDLDWNLLRTFVVIAEVKSITRAAERLNLKQPSVSNALRRLEDRVGRRLVERDATRFELTEVGRLIYEQSVEVFGTISQLPLLMRGISDDVTGHVMIATASHVVSPLFDRALAEFHRNYPRGSITISVAASTEVAKQVRERRASFGICLVSQRDPALDYTMVYREFFGFFCGPQHRLFGKTGLTLADLRGEPSVSFQTDHISDALRPVALLRSEAKLNADVVGVSSSLEEVRRMIVAGLGIGPLPLHVARRDVADGMLWRLPPYDAPPAIDIFLLTNPDKAMNRAEKALLSGIQALIAETPLQDRIYSD